MMSISKILLTLKPYSYKISIAIIGCTVFGTLTNPKHVIVYKYAVL